MLALLRACPQAQVACQAQNNEFVQHFTANCIDKVPKNVRVTTTLREQRVLMWITAALGTVVQYYNTHSTVDTQSVLMLQPLVYKYTKDHQQCLVAK
eukprot:4507513-Pleurochrysis_carterae.AAC.1